MNQELLNELVTNNSLFMHIMNSFVLIILISIFITVRITGKKWLKINDYLGTITKTINSVRYGDLTKKIEKADLPSSEPLAESLNRMIETLSDREKMVSEYQNELHRQNKLLEAVINSLSDGLIIIDENFRVLRATPKISEWFNIEGNRLMGEFTEKETDIVIPLLPRVCEVHNPMSPEEFIIRQRLIFISSKLIIYFFPSPVNFFSQCGFIVLIQDIFII